MGWLYPTLASAISCRKHALFEWVLTNTIFGAVEEAMKLFTG